MKIFLIAGEASGDVLGGRLMTALKKQSSSINFPGHFSGIHFSGIGGKHMQQAGMDSLFDMNDLAVMGFAALLPRLPRIAYRLRQTVDHIARIRPDIVVTIDLPGFNFRLVRHCRRRLQNQPIHYVHYVAPSVWAWHPKRAPEAAALFDHMLALLPFEPSLFTRFGLKTTYVGHAALEEQWQQPIKEPRKKRGTSKVNSGLLPVRKCLGVMPGSRNQEIQRHMPLFRKVVEHLCYLWPELSLSLLAAPGQEERVRRLSQNWPHTLKIFHEPQAFFSSCRVALAVSGMATIEALHAGVVPIVAYRTDPFSAWLAQRLIRSDYANLVNILEHREIVPEYLLHRCNKNNLILSANSLLHDDVKREDILHQSRKAIAALKPPKGYATASAAAAAAILSS